MAHVPSSVAKATSPAVPRHGGRGVRGLNRNMENMADMASECLCWMHLHAAAGERKRPQWLFGMHDR
jgi:hypothetical protein